MIENCTCGCPINQHWHDEKNGTLSCDNCEQECWADNSSIWCPLLYCVTQEDNAWDLAKKIFDKGAEIHLAVFTDGSVNLVVNDENEYVDGETEGELDDAIRRVATEMGIQ